MDLLCLILKYLKIENIFSLVNYVKKCSDYLSCTLPLHPLSDYSRVHPTHRDRTALMKSHFLCTVFHPTIFSRFLGQRPETFLRSWLFHIQADGKLRLLALSPSSHHTLFPRFHCKTLLLCPRRVHFHRPIEHL